MENELEYTTQDEVEFLFNLADRGKWDVLFGLKHAYKSRSWAGEGMNVKEGRVTSALDFILTNRRLVA